MNITLKPEVLFYIGNIGITNSLFTAIIIIIAILIFFALFNSSLSVRKPGKFQTVIEAIIKFLFSFAKDILGASKAKKLFGFLFTFFIFILISNWFGLLPIALTTSLNHVKEENQTDESEQVVEHKDPTFGECIKSSHCYLTLSGLKEFEEPAHVFRAPTSDLSATLALALIAVIAANAMGLYKLRLKYIKKFVHAFSLPKLIREVTSITKQNEISTKAKIMKSFGKLFNFGVDSVVGILEIISEMGKIVSFSFRLLGNVFAGEVLLVIITSLTFGLATLPFLGLEIFVGIIQALVFFMLVAVFINLATTEHEEH